MSAITMAFKSAELAKTLATAAITGVMGAGAGIAAGSAAAEALCWALALVQITYGVAHAIASPLIKAHDSAKETLLALLEAAVLVCAALLNRFPSARLQVAMDGCAIGAQARCAAPACCALAVRLPSLRSPSLRRPPRLRV